ncbi:MAG: hypothetical protein K2O53_03110 [Bacteroidales bacterium]|nr:hypothetical protein [Bacteroidales bacterium]
MRKIVLSCLLTLAAIGGLRAQVGTNLYYMDFVPQQSANNPAFQAPYDFYFGFPGLSGIHAQINNDAFAWNNLVERGVDDSLRFNVGKFVGRLHNRNLIGLDATEEILRFGFKKGENYFQVGLSAKVDANVVLTKPFLSFLLLGPGQFLGDNRFDHNAIDATAYAYLYFGWSRKISEMVTVGARAKLIGGLYNLSTKNLGITWNVLNDDMADPSLSPYTYELKVDGQIRSNMLTENFKPGSLGLGGLGRDWGFGIDMGVSVDFAPNWRFTGSVLDLGAIFWKDAGARVYRSRNDSVNYPFQGLAELNVFGEDVRFDSLLSRAVNTIIDTLNFESDTNYKHGYATMLPTTLMFGFDYTLLEQHRFGIVFKGKLLNNYFSADVGIAYTYTPCKNFAVSVSNTFGSSGPLNLGFAIAGNLGPLQLHLGVDRINSFNVAKMRTAAVTFGINFVIGKYEIHPSKIAYIRSERAASQNMEY